MTLSEERLKGLLAYCRIEDPTEDELATLEGLYGAAMQYMVQAGISEPENGTPRRAQYDLCVNSMVLDGYDARGSQAEGSTLMENPAFRRMLSQLKLTDPSWSM